MTGREVADVLERHGIRGGRRLGQHFLIDQNIVRRIAASAAVTPGDRVLEVGPGIGVLTSALVAAGARVTAVELDRRFRLPLAEALGVALPDGPTGRREAFGPAVEVLWGDAVRLPWAALAAEDPRPWRICSNLPYYITGPFLAHLFAGGFLWATAVLLVQAEAAARMAAEPGSRTYGAFSCLVAYHAEIERLFAVPRQAFRPPPEVDSVVVRLTRRPAPPVGGGRATLAVVRAGFAQRRKTLRNALAAGLGAEHAVIEAALAEAGIAAQRRAETLSLGEFASIARALGPAVPPGPAREPQGTAMW